MAVVIVAVVIGLVVAHRNEQERGRQFQALADEMELQFHPTGSADIMAALSHLRLFNRGRGRRFTNMIAGQTDDLQLALFGYRYTTGGGKNSQTHNQSVITFWSPRLHLPEFELRPEHFFHRIGRVLGYQDINFPEHPNFSSTFLLRGPDETAIREFFNPQRLAFLEQMAGISIEGCGDRLIIYRAGRRISPSEAREFMAKGFEVYAQFKTDQPSQTETLTS
jgi:hypothetical protein